MISLKLGDALPGTVGLCADAYHEVRDLRLAMQKETDAVAAREKEIKEHIIDNLSKSDDTGAAGKFYRAQIVSKIVVAVTDWGVTHSWIRKNDRFDMLQKRLNDAAVKDWMEQNDGKSLPGTEVGTVPDVSITKI